jgi:hypothetical protein
LFLQVPCLFRRVEPLILKPVVNIFLNIGIRRISGIGFDVRFETDVSISILFILHFVMLVLWQFAIGLLSHSLKDGAYPWAMGHARRAGFRGWRAWEMHREFIEVRVFASGRVAVVHFDVFELVIQVALLVLILWL